MEEKQVMQISQSCCQNKQGYVFKTAVTPVDPDHSVFQVKKKFIQFYDAGNKQFFFYFKMEEDVGKESKDTLRTGQLLLLQVTIPVHCENGMKHSKVHGQRPYEQVVRKATA